jgi:serine/threonine protein kinase
LNKFLQLFDRLQNLQHHRLIKFYGYHRDNDQLIVFMEFLPNGSVRDRIGRESSIDHTIIIKYMQQTAQALQYLHHQQPPIIHRYLRGELCKFLSTDHLSNS